jgi:ligand-binding SRPBCC domain-containing protein
VTTYSFVREQVVPPRLEEVFTFFSRAENLECLTPGWLIQNPERGFAAGTKGTQISYALRVHGLLVRWTSEILEWDPPHRFVDVDRVSSLSHQAFKRLHEELSRFQVSQDDALLVVAGRAGRTSTFRLLFTMRKSQVE